MRLRIAAVIAAIVLLAVVGLGVAVHVLLVLDRVGSQRSAAEQRVAAATQIYARTGLLSFDVTVDDPRLPKVVRDAVRDKGARAVLVTGGSTRTVWAAERRGSVVLSARSTFVVEDQQLRTVDQTLIVAGLVTVVAAVALGLVSAGGLARRLRRAAAAARDVADGGSQSLRSQVGGRRDEVGDLADAVDAMAEQLGERLRAEQRFTADVAHDLRTPVTGLVTAAALLDESRPAQLVRDRASVLATLVEDLLEVARLDRGAEEASLEEVDLGRAVQRAVRRAVAAGDYDADAVEVEVDPVPCRVLTDARRLERVLSNLTRNAVQHGGSPVEVAQQGASVTVRDHGPGFPAETLAEGPQRFRSNGGGHGLGLVIAVGQARVLDAELRLDNAAEGGARVTLRLPSSPGPSPVTEP